MNLELEEGVDDHLVLVLDSGLCAPRVHLVVPSAPRQDKGDVVRVLRDLVPQRVQQLAGDVSFHAILDQEHEARLGDRVVPELQGRRDGPHRLLEHGEVHGL